MARPREFAEDAVLDAAMRCFWARGYEATSVRDLIEKTGITGASLYNAFGDKRALYQKALDHYVEDTIMSYPALRGVTGPRRYRRFFLEIVRKSSGDREHKGCMVVNAALDAAPNDPEFKRAIAAVLMRIERFFLGRVEAGQADGTTHGL